MAEINPLYPIKELTQAQYDALGVKDANTLYAIPFDGVPPSHQIPASGSTLPCILITQADYDELGTYDGNTLYCIGHPEPVYDETKIAVVLLDENDDPTEDVTYFYRTDHGGAVAFMEQNPNNRYWVRVGNEITTVGSLEVVPPYSHNGGIKNLVKFTIEGSIDEIWNSSMAQYGAFANCTNLKYVDLGKTIENIPSYAFVGCTSLKTVKIPETCTIIRSNAFSECTSLTSFSCPQITSIQTSAFENSGLLDIELENVQTIYMRAFRNTPMTTINLPSSLTSIQGNIFTNCTALTLITIDKPEGSISGAPWGAPNATVVWTG